jgi:hypothetical protein
MTGWLEYVAGTGDMRNACVILIENLKRINCLHDRGLDGRITLKFCLVERGHEGVDWIYLDLVTVALNTWSGP